MTLREEAAVNTVNVYAHALRADHLPVIDGEVRDIVRVYEIGTPARPKSIEIEWVPVGAPLFELLRVTRYARDALVPCVRRAEWEVAS